MKADVLLDLPNTPEGYSDGDVVVVLTGMYAGMWEATRSSYAGKYDGYWGGLKWVGYHCPEAVALREMKDLARSALYAAGIENSKRAVWPGPTKRADKVLEWAMVQRGDQLPKW